MEKSLENIILQRDKLVKQLLDYSVSQKEDWQQIPLLALEADGRSGYLDTLSRAYHYGLWALESTVNHGYYMVYVDLATGELIDASSAFDYSAKTKEKSILKSIEMPVPLSKKFRPAMEEYILRLAFNLDELNAQKIISWLKKEAKRDCSKFYNPEEQKIWRSKLKKELNLSKLYTRE